MNIRSRCRYQTWTGICILGLIVAAYLPALAGPVYLTPYNELFQKSTPEDTGSPEIRWVPTGEWYEPWVGYWTDLHSRTKSSDGSITGTTPFSYHLESQAHTSLFPVGLLNESSIRQTQTFSTSLALVGDPGAKANVSLHGLLEGVLWVGHLQLLGFGGGTASMSSQITITQPSSGYEYTWDFADFVSLVSVLPGQNEAEKPIAEAINVNLSGLVMEAGNNLTDIHVASVLSAYASAWAFGHALSLPGPALTAAHAGRDFTDNPAYIPRLNVSLIASELTPQPVPESGTSLAFLILALISLTAFRRNSVS